MTKSNTKKTEKRSSLVTWGPAASIIVIFVIYVISQIIALVLVNLYPLAKHWDSQQTSNWINNSVIGQFWFVVVVEALSLLLLNYFLNRRKTSFRALGLNRRPKISDLYYIIAGFVVYFGVFYITLTAVTKAIPQFNPDAKQNIGFSSSTAGSDLWLVFVSLVILPPIVEEILFRGFLYTGLRGADWRKIKILGFLGKYPKIMSAIVTSLIFASLHLLEGNGGLLWVAGLDTFILSLVLVYLREKTDALYASMGVHMIKNMVAFAGLFIFHLS